MYPFTSVRAAATATRDDHGRQSIVALPDGGGPSNVTLLHTYARMHARTHVHRRRARRYGRRTHTHIHAHAHAHTHGPTHTGAHGRRRDVCERAEKYMPLPWLLCLPPGRPCHQLTRARPRMGGASLGARAQPPRTPRTRPGRPRSSAAAATATVARPAGEIRARARSRSTAGRAEWGHHSGNTTSRGSRSLRTAAADQSVYVLRAGRYVNGSRACV